jgi:S-adenosylmethionine decarboxylase
MWSFSFTSFPYRYLFTLDLPEFWENKHADQTLEVLMSDLDPAIMDQFFMKDGVSANDVTRVRPTH